MVFQFLVSENLGTFKYFLLLFVVLVVGGCLEEFVARVRAGGKVTVPSRLRESFGVKDCCYVRLVLVEVLEKGEDDGWVRRRVG